VRERWPRFADSASRAVGERAHIVCAPLSGFFGHRSPLPKGTPKRSALLRAESGADMDAQ
jgi:hypothetical protein